MNAKPRGLRWPWAVLAIVLSLLGTALWMSMVNKFGDDLAHARLDARSKLELVASVVSTILQEGRYQDIEGLLRKWGKQSPRIAQFQLVSDNGFVLANVQSAGNVEYGLDLEEPIAYSYHGKATLRIRTNLADVYQRQQHLEIELAAIFSIFAALLTYLVHLAIQRHAEALALRQRTHELEAASYALAENEDRLQLAVHASNVGLWDWDLRTNAVHYSPEWKRQLGYGEDEIAGRFEEWESRVHPEDLPAARARTQDYLRNPKSQFESEFRLRHKDGSYRWIYARGQIFRDESGQPVRILGCHIDITERMAAEYALRESEKRHRELFESNPHPMWVYDIETLRFLGVNDTAIARYGFNREDFLRMTIKDIRPQEDVGRLEAFTATPLPEVSNSKAWRHRTRSGNLLDVEILSHNMVFEGQQARMVVAYDITDRKRAAEALAAERTLLRTLIDAIPDVVFAKDSAGLFTICNSAELRHVGLARDEDFVGKSVFDFYPRDMAEAYHSDDLQALSGQSVLNREELSLDATGVQHWYLTTKVPLYDRAGKIIGMVGTSRDITDRRNQEQKISRLSRIYAVLSGINSAIVRIRDRRELFQEACRIIVEQGHFSLGWIAGLDQATGKLMVLAQAGIPEVLAAASDFFNSSVGLVPAGTAEVALREKAPAFDNDIEDKPGLPSNGIGPDTLAVRRAAIGLGAKSVIVLPLLVSGQTFGILTLYANERNFFDDEELKLLKELAGDISFALEFIAKEERVDYLAYYDTLTGLPNRSLFFDRLTHQIGSAARDGVNVALVLMNVDRFRLVNDTLGRQAGDALIGAIAHRVKDAFRDRDTVARVGADSFAIAVSGTWHALDAAYFLETHNRQIFGRPFVLGQEELRVSASAGIAVFPTDADNAENLFANAEAALKKAKTSGERFLFYGPEMNSRLANSLRLENRLRHALDNGEMVLWYQPKVDVRTRAIAGFEALMRWQNPETGMVPPAQFIPLMEQTGLILEAGRWALTQVAKDCGQWSATGIKPPRVAVNVSPIQIRQKDFVASIVDAFERTEKTGASLDLEITESTIMENVESIIPILKTIRGLGVQIAVDDFGTGYSSLAYIARLPINDLKIDRSFVVSMTESEDSLAIVRSVISLAHALRMIVVAEGVETEEQAALLLELGCDRMQGYLFSRPVPPERVLELIRRQQQTRTENANGAGKGSSAATKGSRSGTRSPKRR